MTGRLERPRDIPALILGKGITALGALRSFGRRSVPVFVLGAQGDLVRRSRWYRTLPGQAGGDLPDNGLAEILGALSIPRMVLLPTSDKWAMSASRLPASLASRFPSCVPPPEVLERLVDKGRFAATLDELSVPHPRTLLLDGPESLRPVSDEQLKGCFLKPTQSGPFAQVYGYKALHFRDRAAAERLLAEAKAKDFSLMLQEYIPGPATQHHFVEGFLDRTGRACGLFARRRIRMYPTDFGNSTSTLSIPMSEVTAASETLLRLLRQIGYHGIFSAEFKLDERDGQFKLLEVNARPWWYVGFAARSGIDVCDMAYREALGETVEPVETYRAGRRCIFPRLDLEVGLLEWRAGRLPLSRLFRSWIGAEQLTLCWDDPQPGLREIFTWSKGRLRRKLGW